MSTWDSICEEFRNQILISKYGNQIFNYFLQIPRNQKVSFIYQCLKSSNCLPQFNCSSAKSTSVGIQYRNIGNDFFRTGKYIEALHYYTKSVASSPFDGEELALAYGNRSAVLFKLRKFSSALLDINRALRLPHSKSFEDKLLIRKHECFVAGEEQKMAAIFILNSLSALTINDHTLLQDIKNGYKNCEIDVNGVEVNYGAKCSLPLVDFHNKLLPNASEKIKLDYNKDFGRLLVATENIKPGKPVVIDKPFASVLLENFFYTHCSNCYLRNEMLIPCTGCSVIMFCSDKCRREALDTFHAVECKIIPFLVQMELNQFAFLALRILLIASNQGKSLKNLITHPVYSQPFYRRPFNANEIYDSGEYAAVHDLFDNFEKKDTHFLFYRAATAAFLVHILKMTTFFEDTVGESSLEVSDDLTNEEEFCGSLLFRYMYIVEANAHEIFEVEEKQLGCPRKEIILGSGLYPLICMANHSCNPNLVRYNYKSKMIYYTVAPVSAGEQLFDNYGQHFSSHTLKQRQEAHQKYLFKCKCEPCISNWPLYEQLPFENPTYLHPKVDIQQLEIYSKLFNDWLKDPQKSEIQNETQFLSDYLVIMYETIKQPWKEYLECQESLKQILALRANYYVNYSS